MKVLVNGGLNLSEMTAELFVPRRGEAFILHTFDNQQFPAALERVTPLRSRRPGAGGAAFSLEFRVPGQTVLPQRIYRLEHPGLGVFDVFLVPLALDDSGLQLQAVFN